MDNNASNDKPDKVVFRASSGDFEITESSAPKRKDSPPQPAKKRENSGSGSQKQRPPSAKREKPKKKKRRWLWLLTLLLIPIALAVGAYYLSERLIEESVEAAYAYYLDPDEILSTLEPHSYVVSTYDEALIYIAHPSLNEGDTIVVNDNFIIDIDKEFGGFLSMGLVNFDCSAGSLTFVGGAVVMASGREELVSMNGVAFDGTDLFIDAAGVELEWKEAHPLAKINAKTLNGKPSLKDNFVIPAPGGIMTVPVTLTNLTSSAQNDIVIQLISPAFIFPGDPVTVSLPAGGSQVVDVKAIVAEGGRTRIFAVGKNEAGVKVIDGHSDYMELLGGGYYSGDPHTHTAASYTKRGDSSLEENVKYAAEKGHSFIISVENDEFAEKLTQQEVDVIVGESGVFLQLTALETGRRNQLRHILMYNYNSDVIPRSDYEASDFRKYTMQEAIWTAFEEDPEVIVYIPHPFGYGLDIQESLSHISSLYGISGIELLEQTAFSDWTEFVVTVNIWNNINIYDRQRVFGLGASNNIYSEYVGSRYTKGYMTRLSEDNIHKMLREGDMFASNGPELRFTLNDVRMGKDLFVELGDIMTARIYASSETPLTKVQLIRYDVDGSWETLRPDYVLDLDFTGQEVYEYVAVMPVEVPTNLDRSGEEIVQKSIYRLEVRSESSPFYEDVGLAFGNPIWVSSDGERVGTSAAFTEVFYEEKPPRTAFGFDINLAFFENYIDRQVESRIVEELGGAELFAMENGDYYIKGNFTINALYAVPKEGQQAIINYHRYNSDAIADRITVVTSVPGQLFREVITIYLLD